MADLRKDNLGVVPQARYILEDIRGGGRAFSRGRVDDLDVHVLSNKMNRLKEKFATTAGIAKDNGGRLPPEAPHRERELFRASKRVWPEVFADHSAAYMAAKAGRRRAKLRL